jgi:hypothetical protein
MRLPRVQFTVRSMMVLIALVALGLVLAEEFQDGIPPRFVVCGIPKRVGWLRPGMTWEQTREILGLEQTWLTGGTGGRPAHCWGDGHYMHLVYDVRPTKIVVRGARAGGGSPTTVKVLQSTATIELVFDPHLPSGNKRLVGASFSIDSTTIAEMRGSR